MRETLEQIFQDVRFGWRLLVRSPGFAAVALLTLALGIGATTAMFTVVDAVLLRPLPFRDSDRLVMVFERSPSGNATNVVQPQNYIDWRTRNRSFEGLAAMQQVPMNVAASGEALQVLGLRVTHEFFTVLGVAPARGRPIGSGEDLVSGPRTAVIGHGFWQQRLGGRADVIGQQISVNGIPHELVGIMPAGFALPGVAAELFVSLPLDPGAAPRQGRNLTTVARLRPGVTRGAAQAEMESIAAQTARERPDMNARWGVAVVSLAEHAVGHMRLALLVLFAAVACVLLIACTNLANLLLMRAGGRAGEITVRLALGARRARLIQQLAIESLLLAAIGGALGLLLAQAAVPAIVSLFPASVPLPRAEEIGISGRVLAFTALVSAGAGLFFGIAPAMQPRRSSSVEALQPNARTVVASQRRLRGMLVIAEVALAFVLVVGAGLMVRSLVRLYQVDPGFEPERVLTMRLLLIPSKNMELPRRAAVLHDILERVRAIPGISAAGSIHLLPLSGGFSGTSYSRPDRPPPASGETPTGAVSVITPGYLEAMGIPLVAGRQFDQRDALDTPRVALVNRALAQAIFPGEDPIGKRLRVAWGSSNTGQKSEPEFEIVGVAGDVRHAGLHVKPEPTIFIAHAQEPNLLASIVVRTASDPLSVATSVRQAIRSVDAEQGVSHVRTMEGLVDDSVARPRLQTALLGAFALLALVLACIGLYGVLSYSVQQRRREMGVRLAIGATPHSILRLIMSEGMQLTALGLGVGLLVALALTRQLSNLLYEVRPYDPAVLVGVGGALFLVGAAACFLPARRATQVDPVVVLREE